MVRVALARGDWACLLFVVFLDQSPCLVCQSLLKDLCRPPFWVAVQNPLVEATNTIRATLFRKEGGARDILGSLVEIAIVVKEDSNDDQVGVADRCHVVNVRLTVLLLLQLQVFKVSRLEHQQKATLVVVEGFAELVGKENDENEDGHAGQAHQVLKDLHCDVRAAELLRPVSSRLDHVRGAILEDLADDETDVGKDEEEEEGDVQEHDTLALVEILVFHVSQVPSELYN